jgi:hypothetical protein
MNTKIVYESKKPKFAIRCDEMQWILSKQQGKKVWAGNSYYPTLAMLLEDLAEWQFRVKVKKVSELKELDKTINKVYKLIDKVAGHYGFKGVFDHLQAS